MGGDVAFTGDTLSFVGRHYDGAADTTIDGTDLMVMPGLIDLHSHPSTEPFYRGVREEHGVPAMYMSGLYERSVALQPDAVARKAGKQVAFCEMLLSGVTSVADLSGIDEGWIEHRGAERAARVPGTVLRLGALATGERLGAEIPLGRGGRAARPRCGAGADRSRRRRIRRAGCRASSRRRRSTPAPPICCATASPRPRRATCRSPCTARRASTSSW